MSAKKNKSACRRCGCTQDRACGGGCAWVSDLTICSACLTPHEIELVDELEGNVVSAANSLDSAKSELKHALQQLALFKHILKTGGAK